MVVCSYVHTSALTVESCVPPGTGTVSEGRETITCSSILTGRAAHCSESQHKVHRSFAACTDVHCCVCMQTSVLAVGSCVSPGTVAVSIGRVNMASSFILTGRITVCNYETTICMLWWTNSFHAFLFLGVCFSYLCTGSGVLCNHWHSDSKRNWTTKKLHIFLHSDRQGYSLQRACVQYVSWINCFHAFMLPFVTIPLSWQ